MPQTEDVPAVVAYTSPLRLVFRDTQDQWSPTIADIKKRTYDYVKLHRLSTSLDIGLPSPWCMHIAFDGSLLLPKIEKFWPVEKAVSAFNENLGFILVGGIYFGPVEPPDVDQAVLYKTGYYRSFGLASGFVGQIRMALQGKFASPLHSYLLHEPKHIFAADIHKAYKDGKAICSQIPSLSPEFLVHGMAAFISHDWGISLSHLWITAEQVIEHLWRTKIIDGELQPNPSITGRRDFLNDFRTWTTSTRVELLFQKDVIPATTYRLLNLARKARNALVHSGTLPERTASEAALDGVFELMACATTPQNTDYFSARLQEYKELDPIQRHYECPKEISTEEGGIWFGPLPPIPGEETWGNQSYENVFE